MDFGALRCFDFGRRMDRTLCAALAAWLYGGACAAPTGEDAEVVAGAELRLTQVADCDEAVSLIREEALRRMNAAIDRAMLNPLPQRPWYACQMAAAPSSSGGPSGGSSPSGG